MRELLKILIKTFMVIGAIACIILIGKIVLTLLFAAICLMFMF